MKIRNPWSGLEGLPREVWTLCIATFINRSGTMVLPFLILYLTQGRGISADRAGAGLFVYGLGSMLAQPISGRLTDRVGAPRILRVSLFLSALLLWVLAGVSRYETILVVIFVWAFVNDAFRPASLAVVGDLVPPEKRKSAYALNRLAVNLGMSFGPAVGGFLAMQSFRWLFLVDAMTALAAGLLLVLSPWRVRHATEAGHEVETPAGRHTSALADPRMLYFVVAFFPIILVFFQHLGAMPLYLVRDQGMPASHFGLLGTLNTGIILLLEVAINHATAHWPHRRALALGSLLGAAGFGALVWARTTWAAAGTVVLWTFGEMILFPGSSAYVAEIAPPKRRGEYMGLYSMVFALSLTIGPWLGTFVLDRFGAAVLWGGAFACGCISVLMLSRLRS